ncbi:heme transporter [Pokkaliibacter plantistimulans]|uniref:Heme exporter protein B n=1 Tax=Pokkaliibacter plantistimulans TaxID=1635171 RepID=A0ABX5LRP6_9GAMM|nr:heme exporter protein CcmB [Pokkaliibacter plantistimulans]PXF29317.1 heme transporter [Pokkaliibacter plantistimulans]
MIADSPWRMTMYRELRLAARRIFDWLNPLVFFLLVVCLFPLAVSPEPALLGKIAPGIVWVAALLATLLGMDGLFRSDFEDGSLEQIIVGSQPIALLISAKVLSYWLLTGLPLTLLAPLLALMLSLPVGSYEVLCLSLLIGTPSLCLIGAIGAALVVGLRRGGVLLVLLVLPLYIPILIFGSGAVTASLQGMEATGQLAILGAFLALALPLAPIATAAALRISING